jgi:polyphosphate kinase 2 (PPK2 family)
LIQRIEGLVTEVEWRQAYRDINEFERALADDRYMVVKFFLHISKKEQGKRLARMEKDKLTRWKVESQDWEHHKKYDQYRIAVEEMLEFTETESGPWTLIEAAEKRWSRVKIFTSIVGRMEKGLEAAGVAIPEMETSGEDEATDDDNGNED